MTSKHISLLVLGCLMLPNLSVARPGVHQSYYSNVGGRSLVNVFPSGYAYQTVLDDGSMSQVFYLSGPQVQDFQDYVRQSAQLAQPSPVVTLKEATPPNVIATSKKPTPVTKAPQSLPFFRSPFLSYFASPFNALMGFLGLPTLDIGGSVTQASNITPLRAPLSNRTRTARPPTPADTTASSVLEARVVDQSSLTQELTSGSPAPAQEPSNPSPEINPAPEGIPAPEDIPAPEEIPAPEGNPAPEGIPTPEEIPAPEGNPAPAESPAPEGIPAPEESPAPEGNPAPEESPAPEETQAPEGSPAPEGNPAPELNSAPEVTNTPSDVTNLLELSSPPSEAVSLETEGVTSEALPAVSQEQTTLPVPTTPQITISHED